MQSSKAALHKRTAACWDVVDGYEDGCWCLLQGSVEGVEVNVAFGGVGDDLDDDAMAGLELQQGELVAAIVGYAREDAIALLQGQAVHHLRVYCSVCNV